MDIEWDTEAVDHMWESHRVTPAQVQEALSDEDLYALLPDPASKTGLSDRYIGWCESRAEVLTVIVVREGGVLYGANAWPANMKDRRIYHEGRE